MTVAPKVGAVGVEAALAVLKQVCQREGTRVPGGHSRVVYRSKAVTLYVHDDGNIFWTEHRPASRNGKPAGIATSYWGPIEVDAITGETVWDGRGD